MEEHVGNLFLAGAVDEIGGAHALLAHPHVERAIGLKGKATLCRVDLHGGDADIEGDGINRRHAMAGQPFRHFRKRPADQGNIIGAGDIGIQHMGLRVAIKAIGVAQTMRPGCAQIAASAQRRVDIEIAGLQRERGQHFGQQHGDVRCRTHATGPSMGRPRVSSSISIWMRCSSGRPGNALNAQGSHSSK